MQSNFFSNDIERLSIEYAVNENVSASDTDYFVSGAIYTKGNLPSVLRATII